MEYTKCHRTVHFKMTKMVNFVLDMFYHSKKKNNNAALNILCNSHAICHHFRIYYLEQIYWIRGYDEHFQTY